MRSEKPAVRNLHDDTDKTGCPCLKLHMNVFMKDSRKDKMEKCISVCRAGFEEGCVLPGYYTGSSMLESKPKRSVPAASCSI